jgi:hypothetical protein
VLRDVARLCGIPYGEQRMLPVEEMRRRLDAVLTAAARYMAQMPDEALAPMLPNRPRTYAQLGWHIANIADAFLEHEEGIPLTFDSYMRVPAEAEATRERLVVYRARFSGHWVAHCVAADGGVPPFGRCLRPEPGGAGVEWAAVAAFLDQPLGVVAGGEGAHGIADLVDGLADAAMDAVRGSAPDPSRCGRASRSRHWSRVFGRRRSLVRCPRTWLGSGSGRP